MTGRALEGRVLEGMGSIEMRIGLWKVCQRPLFGGCEVLVVEGVGILLVLISPSIAIPVRILFSFWGVYNFFRNESPYLVDRDKKIRLTYKYDYKYLCQLFSHNYESLSELIQNAYCDNWNDFHILKLENWCKITSNIPILKN